MEIPRENVGVHSGNNLIEFLGPAFTLALFEEHQDRLAVGNGKINLLGDIVIVVGSLRALWDIRILLQEEDKDVRLFCLEQVFVVVGSGNPVTRLG